MSIFSVYFVVVCLTCLLIWEPLLSPQICCLSPPYVTVCHYSSSEGTGLPVTVSFESFVLYHITTAGPRKENQLTLAGPPFLKRGGKPITD